MPSTLVVDKSIQCSFAKQPAGLSYPRTVRIISAEPFVASPPHVELILSGQNNCWIISYLRRNMFYRCLLVH